MGAEAEGGSNLGRSSSKGISLTFITRSARSDIGSWPKTGPLRNAYLLIAEQSEGLTAEAGPEK
jgi:hypothetical protein